MEFAKFWLKIFCLFLNLKNVIDGFLIKALEASTNLPKFSSDIAAPRFLLLSIGSIIIIEVSNVFVGFPIT